LRTLSATLTAAQKSPSPRPHPQAKIYRRAGGIARLAWDRYFNGAGPDYFHASAMAGDGSLTVLQAYSSGVPEFRRYRVASPGSGSTYGSWTTFATYSHACAIAAYGANVWVFNILPADGHLYRRDSTDYGASYGAAVDMGAISGDATFTIYACAKSLTEALILYSDGTTLYRRRLSGGTWEAAAAWTNTLNSITGVACTYLGDWNVIVTGTDTDDKPGVWTCVLGDGYSAAAGNWSALAELTIAEADSGISFAYPSLDIPDVFRAFFVEAYTGSEAYSRPCFTYSLATADFIDNLWREPVPFNLSSEYGLSLCSSSTYVWLTRADAVYSAEIAPTALDLTDDITHIQASAKELSGTIILALRNDDGRMANIGTPGDTYELIEPGAEVAFSPGYHTTSGSSPEHSDGPAYWITALDFTSSGKKAELVVHAVNGWGLLEGWKARRQYHWPAGDKNIYQLTAWLFARCGLELSAIGSSSTAITAQEPAFTINPGQSARSAILTLLSMVEEVLFFRGSNGYLKYPQSSDSSDYTYGTDHAVLEGIYTTRRPAANRAQVFGDDVFTEDFDWTDLDRGYDNVAQASDVNLDTTAKAHQRGDAMITGAGLRSCGGEITVPLNCGQEMFDVVTITDQRAPMSGTKRRVVALNHIYQPGSGIYISQVVLGALP